jgi:hypothetical protein
VKFSNGLQYPLYYPQSILGYERVKITTTIPTTMMEMEQRTSQQCWNFIMSSFVRSYGIKKVVGDEDFHYLALEWCDDHNYICDIHLDDLRKVDVYFRKCYEEFKGRD